MTKKCPKCRREYETTNTLCPVDGTVLEGVGDPLEGETLAGKYRIEELISTGGMGAVYRATHVLMDKKVAVKVLRPALASDEQIVQRFTREARAASRISHPHAISVTDFGEGEYGIVFLVMEYLGGRTLKELIREEGTLPLQRSVEIMRQVAGALDAAHAEGVVHRDLKSDNIMLEEVGGVQDWAKVLDFGIAKIQEPLDQDPGLTAPNLVIGTPQYMSPEQCSQSSNIDCRSDIYSLGIILFEMLAGRVPFTGESPTGIMMKQLQDAPPSVLELRPELPPAIGEVINRALAKKPEDRFDSAGAFADALAQAAADFAESPTIAYANETARDTNPVLAATSAREDSRGNAGADFGDDATVVSSARTNPMTAPVPLPPATGNIGNPWRVMIPAALLLVGVIGLAYAFSGKTTPEGEDAPGVLRADPNSRPVQPVSPAATGESERNITPGAPAASAPTSTGAQGGAPAFSTNTALPPVLEGDPLALPSAENANTATPGEANSNTSSNPEASPSPAEGRNTNQRRPPVLNPAAGDAPANVNSAAPPPPPPPSPRVNPTPRQRAPETTPQQSPAPPAAGGDSNSHS